MGKTRVYDSEDNQLKENFNDILKEISEIKPQTTFTKEQEEEFLKDAIVIFDYLKSGIDIKSSEILTINDEVPISYLEKLLSYFSEKFCKDDINFYTVNSGKSDDARPVKIHKNLDNENKIITWKPNGVLNNRLISIKREINFVKSFSSTRIEAKTKPELKKMIDYALKNDVILLYDATSNKVCKGTENIKSIYEIENAKKVAIEFRRFSSVDNDNFTCGYLVFPENLKFQEYYNGKEFLKIKDFLKEEINKKNISGSHKKSFLNYAC